jgi:hypothetical protein
MPPGGRTISAHVNPIEARIDSLYNLITGEEGARVCRDIPEAAGHDQPRNVFAYFGAGFLNKGGRRAHQRQAGPAVDAEHAGRTGRVRRLPGADL